MKFFSFKLLTVSLQLSLLLSCNAQNTIEFSGKLTNGNAKELNLEYLSPTGVKPLGTIKLGEDGSINYKNSEPPAEGFYRLKASDQNFVVFLLKPGDKLKLSGDANRLMGIKAEGSVDNSDMLNLNNYLSYTFYRQDSLQKTFQYYQQIGHPKMDSVALVLDVEMQKIMFMRRQEILKLINSKPGSLVSLAAAEQLNSETDVPVFQKILPILEKEHPNSEYVANFKLKVNELSRLAVGTPAPEISVTDPDGKNIKLSDFKGKIVLIDFWASWCGPCRRENPNVVNLYKKYKDKGFEIFGVSLDKDKSAWLGAIKADNLTWKHGSELAFWQSSFCKTYNVTGIPQTFLVDKDGNIIAKGLRGQELEAKLAQLLGS